jgi:hypothetical protein
VATAALAALTGVLAWENRTLLKASAAATEATERAAKAAEDQATASAEALQLDWRPILTFHHTTQSGSTIPMTFSVVYVLNVGRGPSLNIRYLSRKSAGGGTTFQMTRRFSLHAGDGTLDYKWSTATPLPEPADEVWGGTFPTVKEVLICQDQAGHLYRFVDPQPIPDVWRGDNERRPVWVDWYRTWLGSD